MTTAQKYAIGILLALGLVAAGFALTRPSYVAGTISNNVTTIQQGVWWFTNTHYFGSQQQTAVDGSGCLTIGASGSKECQVITGTCSLQQSTVGSFAASSTAQFYCAVPGVSANDLVLADLPAGAGVNAYGAGSPGAGFLMASAYATSSNMIGVTLANLTGTATSSFSQATTTVEYRIIH